MTDFLEPLERRQHRRTSLAEKLKNLIGDRDRLGDDLSGFRAYKPEKFAAELSQLHYEKDQITDSANHAKKTMSSVDGEIQSYKSRTVSVFNIFNYFSEDQKNFRAKISSLEEKSKVYKERFESASKKLSAKVAEIACVSTTIDKYSKFDDVDAERRIENLNRDIQGISQEISVIEGEIARINARAGPHIEELKRFQSKVRDLQSSISAADQFDRRLSAASNGYERAQIHEECERRFGNGSPKKISRDATGEIRKLQNDIPKLEKRIKDEIKKSELSISHIIIDGNNACYERSRFIRFFALSHLVDELAKRYKVTVVFDASIRRLMQSDDAAIERIIGRTASVHVTPTKNSADEYILKMASDNPQSYIISNDRYAEFGDYDAVKSDRVLRFLIADGRVMLNDLDISIPFNA